MRRILPNSRHRIALWLWVLLPLLAAGLAHAESKMAAVEVGGGFVQGRHAHQLSFQGAVLAPLLGGRRDDIVQLIARTEFSYQRFGAQNLRFVDLFATASLQLDVLDLEPLGLLLPKSIVPFLYSGLGLERLSPSFPTTAKSDSGPVFTFGGGMKFFVARDFYITPTLAYFRGFDEVKGNTFRVTGGMGYRF